MTDSELIQCIKEGDVQLYSVLMERYQRKVLAFIYRMLKSSHMESSAEDLCSETFYKAFRSLQSFRETEALFSTWLYTIARNTVLSKLRKQRICNIPMEDNGVVLVAPVHHNPEQQLLGNERCRLVREAINSLPEKQRLALTLREYDQLDYQEIAIQLGQSLSSVKSLLFRARLSLKNELSSYFLESTT